MWPAPAADYKGDVTRIPTRVVPKLSPLYWATLCSASVFGTNTGDIISHNLGLGDDKGLPVLAAAFAAIMIAERWAPVGGALYYWLAVIVLRTAATNLADLATLQLELDYEWVVAMLAVLLAVIVLAGRLVSPRSGERAAADGPYWAAMLAAATLGTALGDFGSHTLTLRLCAIVSVTALAIALFLARRTTSTSSLYWVTIVTARMAGTNVGDLMAFRKGLNLGLVTSTLVTGGVFFGWVLVGWLRSRRMVRRGVAGVAPLR